MSPKQILISISAALLIQQAQATVSLDIQTGRLFTSGGVNIAAGTIGILASDTDGFDSLSLLGTQLLNKTLSVGTTFGTNGQILSVVAASDLSGGGDIGFSASPTLNLTALGLTGGAGTTGSDLAVLWFPGITAAGATLTNGQSFGFYRSDTIDSGSGGTASFNVPSDPGAYSIYALDSTLGGGISPSTFNAAGTVGAAAVPEPSRVLFCMIGFVALVGRRRRK